ncbi:MAG: hypothetical protein QM487_05655 [Candidatus Marithrix sp.]
MTEQILITSHEYFNGVNPYLNIPKKYLDIILSGRDVKFVGSTQIIAEQLFEYDSIFPAFIEDIIDNFFTVIDQLEIYQVLAYGAIYGVDYSRLVTNSQSELRAYTFISLSIKYDIDFISFSDDLDLLRRRSLESIAIQICVDPDIVKVLYPTDLVKIINERSFNAPNIDKIEAASKRYKIMVEHKYKKILKDLYLDLIDASYNPPTDLEILISELSEDTAESTIQKLGMVVPTIFKNDKLTYIENNIVEYIYSYNNKKYKQISLTAAVKKLKINRHDYTIVGYLTRLSDKEIINYLGVYIPFRSRDDLVSKSLSTLHVPQFMYPLSNIDKYSINSETLLGTPVSELSIMFCYGTCTKYYTYEVEELLASFHVSDDGTSNFRRPEDITTNFSVSDIKELLILLDKFAGAPNVNTLISRINQIIIEIHDRSEYDNETIEKFKRLTDESKEYVHKILHNFFIAGMYMRRWKGPGYPYPLKRNETIVDTDFFQIKLDVEINNIMKLIDEMPIEAHDFVSNIRVCTYGKDGKIDKCTNRLSVEWNKVLKRISCIRVASAYFVGTGYHFLRILFSETIPGVDDSNIDSIT